MPSYLWECKHCSIQENTQRLIKDRDVPPENVAEEFCTHDWERVWEMPRVLKASFVDGQRMQNDQTYNNLYKASVLDVDKLDHRPDSPERKEMEKESRALKGQDIGEIKKGPS